MTAPATTRPAHAAAAKVQPTAFSRLRACATELTHHGLKVAAFCVGIACILWLARPGQKLDAQLVYSLATGITTWLLIDGGRFFIDQTSPYGFPRGWRALALIMTGLVGGFLLGTWAGDAYTGRSTFGLIPNQPRFFLYLFLFTFSTGGAISYYFYAVGKSNYLARELETSRLQASEAQLKLLQSQLEPHMLFNTLANLRALIATDPPRATAMLDQLIDYLRATLSASRSTLHPLSAEFDRLKDYLALMAVRMGPRLTYTLDLPDELASLPVPTLLLQPLVENAIKHGLESKVAGGSITVRAARVGNTVTLTVEDTGGALVANVPSRPANTHIGTGFGLEQVRQRLLAVFGAAAALEFIATNAGNTLATITFTPKSPEHA